MSMGHRVSQATLRRARSSPVQGGSLMALALWLGLAGWPLPSSAQEGCAADISVATAATVSSNTGCRYEWSSGDLTIDAAIDAGNVEPGSESALVYTSGSPGTLTIEQGASVTANRIVHSNLTVNVGFKISAPSHTVTEIVNHGALTGSEISVWVNGSDLLALNNHGSMSGYLYSDGGSDIGVLNNHSTGTMTGSFTAIANGGRIGILSNYGSISSEGSGISNDGGQIETLLNFGSISGLNDLGISNSGSIGSLTNRQPGLTFRGSAPDAYFTAIEGTDPNQYGSLLVQNKPSSPFAIGAMTYGIAAGSSVVATTYQNVIVASGGSVFDSLETKDGSFASEGLMFKYQLVWDLEGGWDLVTTESQGGTVTESVKDKINPSALGAARVIDASDELRALFAEQTTPEALSEAASQTLPLLTSGSTMATQSAMTGISRIVQARIEGNRGLSSGEDFVGDERVWLKPFGSYASQGSRSRVSGFDVRTYGVAVGLDGAPSTRLRLGGALAYAVAEVEGGSRAASQDADISIYQLIGYGSYMVTEGTDLSFQLDLGRNQTEGQRQIGFASALAKSDFASHSVHVGLGIGRTRALGGQTTFTPSLRADWSRIQDEGYSESGAGLLDLEIDRRSTDALVLGFDSRLAYHATERSTFLVTLGVGLDAVNDRASSVASFAGAPGAEFSTPGIDPNPWLSRGGLSYVHEREDGMQFTARWDAEARQSFINQTFSVKLRWPF
jgi:outer membrane autotransporter protein